MQKYLLLLFLLWGSTIINAQSITTVVGGGTGGDGGLATAASIHCPEQITFDVYGNMYITQYLTHVIRKVDAFGVISTVAGTGVSGFSGDGSSATAALLKNPSGITTDTVGNIFFCDQANNRIRRIDATTGIITTVAGNAYGYYGDGGPATAALFKNPFGVSFKKPGELYISDNGNYRVRKISTSGTITTIAGNGTAGGGGDGGPAIAAQFAPVTVCFDNLGNMYISDQLNHKVRKVNSSGIISTVAGNSTSYAYNGDNIPATGAYLSPAYIAIGGDGLLYIPDAPNDRVRKVDASGIIHTVAGNGTPGFGGDGGAAIAAQINNPSAVAFDSCGNLFIAHIDNPRIRKVTYNPTPCPYLEVEVAKAQNITIYPNPTKDELHIDGVTTRSEYVLVNVTGITEQRGILKKGGNTIAVTYLPRGVYLFLITDQDGIRKVHKVVKE